MMADAWRREALRLVEEMPGLNMPAALEKAAADLEARPERYEGGPDEAKAMAVALRRLALEWRNRPAGGG